MPVETATLFSGPFHSYVVKILEISVYLSVLLQTSRNMNNVTEHKWRTSWVVDDFKPTHSAM